MLRRLKWDAPWTLSGPHYLLIALVVILMIGSIKLFWWWRLGGPLQGPVSHVDALILDIGMTGNGSWQTPWLELKLPFGETVHVRMNSFQPVHVGEIIPVNIYLSKQVNGANCDLHLKILITRRSI